MKVTVRAPIIAARVPASAAGRPNHSLMHDRQFTITMQSCESFAGRRLVSVIGTYRPISSPAAMLVAAALMATTLAAQTPERASLAGQLLIASPTIGDPRFDRTVVLMVEHTRNGALGIVINLPLEERPLAGLLEMLGEKNATAAGTVRIFAGGPVQRTIGFVVHSAEYHRPGTINIDGRVAMTSSREILLDIGNNRGPQKSLVAFGYAGWGPGQLEGELQRGAWHTAPADPQLVFDADREKVWDLAFARRTRDL
jgi:putative transcriptional regulator